MASRKNKFSFGSLDFSDQSRWSEDDFKRDNALTRAKAYAQDMTAQGATVSQADIDAMADQFYRTGNIDYALEADRKPAAPVLPEPAVENEGGLVGDVALSLRQGSRNVVSGLMGAPVNVTNLLTDPLPARLGRRVGELLYGTENENVQRATGIADFLRVSQPDDIRGTQQEITRSGLEDVAEYGSEEYRAGKQRLEEAEGFLDTAKTLITDPRNTLMLAAEQIPQLLLRVKGSTAGTIGLQSVFAGSLVEAHVAEKLAKKIASGEITKEEAERLSSNAFAFSAGMNAVLPTLPGASTVERALAGSVVQQTGLAAVRDTAGRGAVRGLVGEAITGGASEAGDQIITNVATGEEWSKDAGKNFAIGAILEGPTGAAFGGMHGAQRGAAQKADDIEQFGNSGLINFLTENEAATAKQDNVINRQLFDVEQEIAARDDIVRIAQEREAAFAAREQEQADIDARKAIEEEAGFRTMETERTTGGTRVERYGTSDLPEEVGRGAQVVERVPVQPAAETTPEQVAAEQEAVRQQEAAKAEQDALAPFNATLLKEMEAERKSKEKAEAKKTTEQKAADRKRQREVARQLLAENPGKDITELAPLLRERLAQPETVVSEVTPVEKRVASIRNRMSAAAKAKQTKADNARLKSLVINNPEATDSDIAAMFEGSTVGATPSQATTAAPEPVAEVTGPASTETSTANEVTTEPANVVTGDTDVDNFLGSLKMEVPTNETLEADGEVDIPSFTEKLKNLARRLSDRRSPEAVGTQNLVRTGKLIIAPTAKSVGRNTGAAADYDSATGKMYLYLDKLQDGDDVGAMIRALHESTHAGQFNAREGRDSVLESIMGKERYDAAQTRVRATARKQIREGKQGAERKALEQAQAAAQSNPDFNGDVEALEVMPYYVGNAAGDRAAMSGVRSVAKDIVGSGRKFLRDKLGMDLNVTMQDIDYASRQVANEIVNTELAGSGNSGNLNMVVGGRFTNDPRQRYKGAIDGLSRYVMSDAEAEVMAEHIPALQRGQMVTLGELLNHPPLYEAYPQLREVRVVLDDDQKGYGAGVFNPNTGEIGLSEESVANLDSEDIRNTVLHETQHAVQNIEGFIGGEDWRRLMSPIYKTDEVRDRQRRERAINRFDLGRWKQTTTPTRLQEFNNEVAAKGISGDTFAQSQLVLQNGWNTDSTDRIVQRYGDSVYAPARDALNTSIRALNAENKRAMDLYFRNYGEAEARTTEATSRMTQRELDNISFEEMFPEARNGVRVEDTLDTEGYYQGRRPSGSAASTSLSMATPSNTSGNKTLTEAWKEFRFPKWMYDLFSTKQGMDPSIRAAIEAAKASPSGDLMIARATAGKYEAALRNLAATRNTTVEALNSQIEKDLIALKPQGSWAANKVAFNAVASKYGKAGEYLQELRNQADTLSMEMLKQRALEGGRITKSERDSYKAIAANLGIYTHRQYAAMSGKAGSEFSEKMWADYERDKRNSAVSRVKSENYYTVAKATKRLIDDSLRIPDDAGLAIMGNDRLHRMYDTWVGPSEGITDDEMRTALAAKRIEVTPERMQAAAEQIAKELLGLVDATSPITSYYRGAKLDTGILQKRTDMPKEIRDLLGEITDPMASMLITIGKQAEFLARNNMLLAMRNNVGRDLQPPGSLGTEAAQGMTELKGELWGPLEGYWASPNMSTMLGDMIQHIATFEQALAVTASRPDAIVQASIKKALSTWVKGSNLAKMVQIVVNPINFAYNYSSAYVSLALNGNWNPANVVKGHKAMVQILANAANPDVAGEEAIRMSRLGITDSAFVGELKSGQYRDLETLIKKMSGKDVTVNKFLSAAHTAKKLGVEAYAMMDVWAKMANFYQQVDVLTDFHKKNGDNLTAEEIDRKAADIVNRTNITYKRAMPIVRAAESVSITRFGTYMAEVFRSQVGNAAQAIDEYSQARTAKTPEAKQAMTLQAIRRLGSQLAVWGMLGAVSSMLNSAVFGEDDEEADKLRQLLPEYLRDQDFIKVGRDENGKPILFNISRAIDPIGPNTDIMRSMINLEAEPKDIAKKITDLYVAPSLAGKLYQVGKAVVTGERPSRDPSVQQWFPDVYGNVLYAADKLPGIDDATSRAVTNVAEALVLPGSTNALRKNNPKVVDNEANAAFFGTMRFMGLTLAKLDPNEAVKFEARDYSDTLKNARREVGNLFKDRPSITVAEATDKILEISQREQEAFNKMRDLYLGMKAADLSDSEATAILKDNVQSVENVRAIVNDTFTSQAISKKSIDTFAANEMKGKTQAEKREIQQKWKDVWDVLSQVDTQVKENK